MQKTLLAMGLLAGIGLVCSQSASALPLDVTAVKAAVTAASPLQQAQYSERRTRHGVIKCYREFAVGPYRCRFFPNPV